MTLTDHSGPNLLGAGALTARLIGPLEVRFHDHVLPLGESRPCRHLLARLLIADGRPVPAARLACDLWPNLAPERARACIQMTINGARKVLRPLGIELVATSGTAWGLASALGATVDLTAFRREVAVARRADVDGRELDAADAYERAIVLAGDELLAGEPAVGWIGAERRVFAREVFAARARLAELSAPLRAVTRDHPPRVQSDAAITKHVTARLHRASWQATQPR